jgi:hypothetical protein
MTGGVLRDRRPPPGAKYVVNLVELDDGAEPELRQKVGSAREAEGGGGVMAEEVPLVKSNTPSGIEV